MCIVGIFTTSWLTEKLAPFFASLVVVLAARILPGQDASADWNRWCDTPLIQSEVDVLIRQMSNVGLVPMRRDLRTFQPARSTPLNAGQIPEHCSPFGLSLATYNTTVEQLMTLRPSQSLYSLTLHGFQNGEQCVNAARQQTNLRFLSLSECGVTDQQLGHLTDLHHLETLDLRKTLVRGSGLSNLKSLPHLQSLEIDMSEEQFQTLLTNQLVHLLPIAHDSSRSLAKTDLDIATLELNSFYGFRVTDEMLQNLAQLSSLRDLSLIEAQITNDAIVSLRRVPHLQKLNLERTRIDDRALHSLVGTSSLQFLVLDETEITVDGLKVLSKLNTLNELHLNRCQLDDASLNAISVIPHLEHLELAATQIRFETETMPGSFASLQHLNVNGSGVKDDGLRAIAQLPELRWLDLTLCRVGDPGMLPLSRCRKLEVLYLNRTDIGDEALRHLAAIGTLQVLSLHGSAITDVGLQHVSKMKGLRSLVLVGTQVSQPAIQRLQTELPQCEIVW